MPLHGDITMQAGLQQSSSLEELLCKRKNETRKKEEKAMAHFWISQVKKKKDGEGKELLWAIFALKETGQQYELRDKGGQPVRPRKGRNWKNRTSCVVQQLKSGKRASWILIAGENSPHRINGERLFAGIRVLRDKDEIQAGKGQRLFFSTETLAEIEPLPDFGKTVFCPRCKTEIEVGRPAVCCPRCSLWHHEDSEKEFNCWTYAPECSSQDGQPTELNGNYQWRPEDL